MDNIPFKFEIKLNLDDYLDLIDYLKKHKTLKRYGNEADKQLDKHIDRWGCM